MWTSSTPAGLVASTAICHHLRFRPRSRAPRRAAPRPPSPRRRSRRRRGRPAGSRPAASPRRTPGTRTRAGTSRSSSRAPSTGVPSRHQLERERERVRHDLAQVAGGHLHGGDAPAARALARDPHHRLGDRELVHQQIRGSGSPTSWSITRRPPKAVSTSTIPGGSARTSPICRRRLAARHGAQRGERGVCGLRRDERDQHALVRDVHRVDPEDLRRAGDGRPHRHVRLAHRHADARTRAPAR